MLQSGFLDGRFQFPLRRPVVSFPELDGAAEEGIPFSKAISVLRLNPIRLSSQFSRHWKIRFWCVAIGACPRQVPDMRSRSLLATAPAAAYASDPQGSTPG